MKRSGPLNLMLMATTAFAVAGCEDPQVEGNYYKTVEQCISSGAFSEVECREAFVAGRRMNTDSAPRYNSRQLCEQQHGLSDCDQRTNTSGSGSYFVPLATGYFIGQAVGGASDNWNNRVRPIYPAASRRGAYTSGGGVLFYNNSTRRYSLPTQDLSKPPAPAKVQTRTSVASRGGFGSRSRSGGS